MDIYLMRHGQTSWNVELRMQGRADIPLNENGIQQAKEAALEMSSIPFDCILSSPLSRAYQTAEIVNCDRGLSVIKENLLIEIGFGAMEGAYRFKDPARCETFFSHPELYIPENGGESYEELDRRCTELLECLIPSLAARGHNSVLMCSHGGLIKGVINHLLQKPLKDFWSDAPQKNCSRTLLQYDGTEVKLISQGGLCESPLR